MNLNKENQYLSFNLSVKTTQNCGACLDQRWENIFLSSSVITKQRLYSKTYCQFTLFFMFFLDKKYFWICTSWAFENCTKPLSMVSCKPRKCKIKSAHQIGYIT